MLTRPSSCKEKVKAGGKILALRILPGVDVLETRWSGAKGIFDEAGLNVVGVEFTDGDPAKTKSIVSDYIQREGTLDGVWMDAGATAVAAIEAFEDAGQEVPPITGEDQNDFLTKWKEDGLTAVAPTYSNFQWRTAVIAATEDPQGRGGPEGVGPAAAEDHRGDPGPVRQAEHAAAVLRAVRLRGPAGLPARSGAASSHHEARRQHVDLGLPAHR